MAETTGRDDLSDRKAGETGIWEIVELWVEEEKSSQV